MLTEDEELLLHRAGFTLREISLYKQKFYNLLRISPMQADELKELRRAREDYNNLHKQNQHYYRALMTIGSRVGSNIVDSAMRDTEK